MINVAELLKDAPKGTELWFTLYGKVKFMSVNFYETYPIQVRLDDTTVEKLDKYGRYYDHFEDGECVLFPSKDCRTWEGWKPHIESKFKVGDWIVRGEGFVYEPSLITEIKDYYICELLNGERVTYTLNDVHKNFHLWNTTDAKDGDVLVLNGKPFIYSHKYEKNYCYIDDCGQFRVNFSLAFEGNCVCPATRQERDLLFSKMREVGYKWDEEKKELRKIQPHYDIANFKPFDKVLVRDTKYGNWNVNLFSSYIGDIDARIVARFRCINSTWIQCIPYEGNEHLLGTTNMCPEEFINW